MTSRILYELAQEYIHSCVLLSLGVLVRRFVRRCLHIPNYVLKSIIHSPAKDSRLRIMSLTVMIPRLQFAWLDRIERYALMKDTEIFDPIVLKLVSFWHWR